VTAGKLCQDFTDLQFMVGECVEDFTLCTTTIMNQLQAVSDKIMDMEEIKKILNSVPEHHEQVAISIETLLDQNAMSRLSPSIFARWRRGRRSPLAGSRKGASFSRRSGWHTSMESQTWKHKTEGTSSEQDTW
jgi:hypothetical protein